MCIMWYVCTPVGLSRDKGSVVITKEDLDRHNKGGGNGAWIIIHGKVYDVESLAMQVWII